MTTRLTVIVCAMLLALGVEARDSIPKPRADLNIREMTSAHVGDFMYRALLGFAEIYPFLVIEKVQLPLDEAEEPTLVASWRLQDMVDGGGFGTAFEGDNITQVHWNGDRLEFRFHGSRGHTAVRGNLEGDLTCVVSGIRESKPAVACRPAR